MRALATVPTLRSFLKLYTNLDANKLANFLDGDEEELVQQLMNLKLASRSVSRAGIEGGRLLDGETISTSDTDFVINEVRKDSIFNADLLGVLTLLCIQNVVSIVESTIGRRYGSLFIRNTEYAERIFDNLRATPLPKPKPLGIPGAPAAKEKPVVKEKAKVTWAKV